MTHQRTVYLVDEDPGDRHHLAFRLGAAGVEAWPFASVDAFAPKLHDLEPQIIVLDVAPTSPDSAGLVTHMMRRGIDWPIIAISRSRDLELAVETMKLGVVDFLPKPIDEDKLLAAVGVASGLLSARLQARDIRNAAAERVAALTPREISICRSLLAGQPNKVTAHHLGISVRTVEAHRANIMMKLHVRSIAEVFLLLAQAGMLPAQAGILPAQSIPSRSAAPPPARVPIGGREYDGARNLNLSAAA